MPDCHSFKALGLICLILVVACDGPGRSGSTVTHIDPSDETGTSLATYVRDVPLAFTNQFYPVDTEGHLAGEDVVSQLDQVLLNMESALTAAGTGTEALVRVHVYLAGDNLTEPVLQHLARALPEESRPAITLVSRRPTRPDVLVSMDAIALAPEVSATGRHSLRYRAESLYGRQNRSHVAVLPPGRKIFIAGQAEMAGDLPGAVRETMRGLLATLAYSGAGTGDVVHIKAFINPAEEAEEIEEVIAGFFRHSNAPPIVTLEWKHERFPAEIELVASAPADPHAREAVSYYAPVWMTQMTTFSRLVDVHKGGLLFTSGLYGEEGQDGEAQARTIFAALSDILDEAGSGYDHLVKGTYYPSTGSARQGLMDVRTDFYNPDRPPAASLAEIEGTGRPGRTLNVDMISVIPDN
ncbi:MAG: Rid family hydrolase [Balneolales bacterium]